jgi:hypothetical protein
MYSGRNMYNDDLKKGLRLYLGPYYHSLAVEYACMDVHHTFVVPQHFPNDNPKQIGIQFVYKEATLDNIADGKFNSIVLHMFIYVIESH